MVLALIVLLSVAGTGFGQMLPVLGWKGCGSGDTAMPGAATVRSELREFFHVFLRRPLTADELGQVTREFLAVVDRRCPTGMLEWNMRMIGVIKAKPDTPQALLFRHQLVARTYFWPPQRGSLIQRLLAKPDPIRVVDSKMSFLMTDRDVAAFGNLQHLAKSGGPPRARSFSRAQLDRTAALLNSVYGDGKNSQHWDMPPLWAYAAAFWVSLEREWPNLTAQQQESIRAFIQWPVDKRKQLKPEMYQRLFGLSAQEALTFQRQYFMDASQADIHNSSMAYIAGLGAYVSTMATINGILGP
jgi:hypothetical protein